MQEVHELMVVFGIQGDVVFSASRQTFAILGDSTVIRTGDTRVLQ